LRRTHARRPALHRRTTLFRRLGFFMTVVANPICRLAPRTRLQSCVHWIPRPFKTAPAGLPKPRIEAPLCSRSAFSNTRDDNEGTKNYFLKQKTAFNIHNPSITHRVR
jgi:hypothetical protein